MTALVGARSEADVLRAAVEAACRATGSRRGVAGRFDGEAATSDAWYDARRGLDARARPLGGRRGRARASSASPRSHSCSSRRSPAPDERLRHRRRPRDGALRVRAAARRPRRPVLASSPWATGTTTSRSATCALLAALGEIVSLRLREAAGAGRRLPADGDARLDVAERLQRRLLPAAPPELAGLDIAFTYRSASAGVLSGGDFVDYYTRPPSGSLAFAIGDVAGKGVDAMATTFVTKFMLRAAVHGGQLSWPTRPGEALQELRNGLLEQPDFDPDTDRFVTVLFGLLNPRTRPAPAGHRRAPDAVPRARRRRRAPAADHRAGHRRRARRRPRAVPHGDPAARRAATSSSLFTDGIAELRDADGRFFEAYMAGVLAGCHGARAADVVARLVAAGERFSARPPGRRPRRPLHPPHGDPLE